jgi:Amt family ammonium transporter
MTLPGLALFYGGLVRAKNFLSVLMHSFCIAALASVLWFALGYTLAFGAGGPWIGDLSRIGLADLQPVREGLTVPESSFALYQMMFAVITPALIVGAFPERVRFLWLMLFSGAWLLVVYVPVAHWIWGGGWLAELGVLDFAGGIVVHATAGISALVLALMIGPRRDFKHQTLEPHSPAMTLVGAGMLWVGWFGFNGGSALAANNAAGNAILATHLAASSAALTWAIVERLKFRKVTSVGFVTGVIAGLATVTPAAGYITPAEGLLLGVVGSLVCFGAVLLIKGVWNIDDSLDVFAIHGVGGILGSLLLAFMADLPQGQTALGQLRTQSIGVGVVLLWSASLTYAIAKAAALIAKMRVDNWAERDGLDISSHGERAYTPLQ